MAELLLLLFWEFFKTGLFAVGGGLATLPFLTEMALKYPWFELSTLSELVAVSESTPGPIGINMATYAGYSALSTEGFGAGVLGALVATLSLVLPSLIVIIIVSRFLNKFKGSKLIEDSFYALRPAVTGLIGSACLSVLLQAVFDFGGSESMMVDMTAFLPLNFVLLILFFVLIMKLKRVHPIAFIAVAAVIGIVLKL